MRNGSSNRAPTGLRELGLTGWRAAERLGDAAFGSSRNPLRHLGAIGFFAFWLLAASGVVLYIVLDTSVQGAHRSIDALHDMPLGLGRLLRGVHRYAADLMVITMLLQLLREWLHGHERGVHRFAWLTGVPLIAFVFAIGIVGFWLNWDRLGQFSATATAEWVDALPFVSSAMARNFLVPDAVSDRLFSLFVFMHLGLPLLLVWGLWFHLQRLTRAAVWPPRTVALGLAAMLAALALTVPVKSQAPAALDRVPEALPLDWFVLFVHPLTDATSPALVWSLMAGAALLLFALPFLPARESQRPPVAVVDPANCNGCRRCVADCPYAAITMVPHPNQRIGRTLAVVDADLCAGCGICAGACPSSTPFRSVATLVTGIDMPQRPIGALRKRLRDALQGASGTVQPVVVFGCDHGADVSRVASAEVRVLSLLCAGQLPPSFVEYALRDGAAGVVVAACREGGCEFRFGERWTAQRLSGLREPHLRESVQRDRVALVFAAAGDEAALARAIESLRQRIVSSASPTHDAIGLRDIGLHDA
jgi:coenzyme F420-reducing hydrogenase delta subunit/ferredoxin